ncbi:hypothetical protein MPNT_50026 [Candidatus Methylacidithermus pantelleriae]|uniref:Uncharacterized protein n=1 Tax=Candidatus Methylacidithermus pantelleriae TaxID=2744239 RepID=A0A8J2BMI1_9BACT|nr:hypothetical protein MPNT_50026 [Candidatus Methylacidithermus pantelleriae]
MEEIVFILPPEWVDPLEGSRKKGAVWAGPALLGSVGSQKAAARRTGFSDKERPPRRLKPERRSKSRL